MEKRKFGLKHVIIGIVLLLVVLGIIGSLGGDEETVQTPSSSTTASDTQNTQSKEDAQKELDEVIDLAKKSGLVTSYEFSDKASVVYIGSVWYTQTVQFKKDFMAKVATLKQAINGFTRFEVRDSKTNEKVAEVKYNSPEVYK